MSLKGNTRKKDMVINSILYYIYYNSIYYNKGGMGGFLRGRVSTEIPSKTTILASCYSCHFLLLIVTIYQVVTVVTDLGV